MGDERDDCLVVVLVEWTINRFVWYKIFIMASLDYGRPLEREGSPYLLLEVPKVPRPFRKGPLLLRRNQY